MIFDKNGAWDAFTLTQIQDPAIHLQHSGDLSADYDDGSQITQVATHTYYLKTDVNTNTYQLMHYDGYKTDLPIVDNVVKLNFSYFGDPQPPMLIPGKSLCDASAKGPFTTYGPKPPCIGLPPKATYPTGENCAFTVAGAQAIRDGADIFQVVNARRGMSTVTTFGRQLSTTTEGVTRRGFAGQRMRAAGVSSPVRLTPQAIYELASDRAEAIRLLYRFGYLL